MTSPEGAPRAGGRPQPPPPPRLSLFSRLFAFSTLVVLAGFGAAYLLADHILQSHLLREAEAALQARADVARGAILALGETPEPRAMGTALPALGRSLGARIRVLSADGTVLADSLGPRGGRGEAAAEAGRDAPEETAPPIAAGDGKLLKVAIPLAFPGGEILELQLDAPLRSVRKARRDLLAWFLLIAALAAGLLLIAGALARRLARREIFALEEAAISLGRGDFEAPVSPARVSALQDLARFLDSARGQLARVTGEIAGERERLEQILDSMEDGVLMIDEEGKVVQHNPAFRSLFGLMGEPVGRRVVELVRSSELQALLEAALESGNPAAGEIGVARGTLDRRILVRISAVKREGRPAGAVLVFHDVTERRRLEKVRQDFVANVSHELKTPLTAIRGYAETLAESPPPDPERTRSFLGTILKHARRLGTLVDDLLELSRIESGQAFLKKEPLSLRAHVERAVQTFEPAARQRGLELSFSVPDDMPPLLADAAALETILSNLVENAVKYASVPGEVRILGAVGDGMARIDVSDTGPGIPPDHVSRLFERFYRVDASRSRELGGTGLGLAIVKHLSQALGGWADVESEPGRGSTFTVYLPLARSTEAGGGA